jgi:hypothetical protein
MAARIGMSLDMDHTDRPGLSKSATFAGSVWLFFDRSAYFTHFGSPFQPPSWYILTMCSMAALDARRREWKIHATTDLPKGVAQKRRKWASDGSSSDRVVAFVQKMKMRIYSIYV